MLGRYLMAKSVNTHPVHLSSHSSRQDSGVIPIAIAIHVNVIPTEKRLLLVSAVVVEVVSMSISQVIALGCTVSHY